MCVHFYQTQDESGKHIKWKKKLVNWKPNITK
jgi:hypothetical protein